MDESFLGSYEIISCEKFLQPLYGEKYLGRLLGAVLSNICLHWLKLKLTVTHTC